MQSMFEDGNEVEVVILVLAVTVAVVMVVLDAVVVIA